jgi:hypothetical protein
VVRAQCLNSTIGQIWKGRTKADAAFETKTANVLGKLPKRQQAEGQA